MPLVVRDSLSGSARTLGPDPDGRPLTIYVCGPTIYAHAHVGHGRTYLYFDLLRRYFRDRGIAVRHVMNITDYEDKITQRAGELGLTWRALARREEKDFLSDFRRLGLLPPHVTPRASAFVHEMLGYAEALVRTGRTRWDGDELYFEPSPESDAHNFPVGEQLSQHAVPEPNLPPPGSDPRARRVLLFRRQKPPAASWPSPWGPGAPGWTLECYAMTQRYLGLPVDLHGGGADLIFPHHYSENAVSLELDHRLFARTFLYTGFVTQQGRKMSKSKGNLVALSDALRRYGASGLRWYLLTPRYNARLEWSEEAAGRARTEYETVRDRIASTIRPGRGGSLRVTELSETLDRMLVHLEDGFGVDGVLDELRHWADRIGRADSARFERGGVPAARRHYQRIERLLGLRLISRAGPG